MAYMVTDLSGSTVEPPLPNTVEYPMTATLSSSKWSTKSRPMKGAAQDYKSSRSAAGRSFSRLSPRQISVQLGVCVNGNRTLVVNQLVGPEVPATNGIGLFLGVLRLAWSSGRVGVVVGLGVRRSGRDIPCFAIVSPHH